MSFVIGNHINTCEQLYLPEIAAGLEFKKSHHGARSISATTRSHQQWPADGNCYVSLQESGWPYPYGE